VKERVELLAELEEIVRDHRQLERLDSALDRGRQIGAPPHQLPHIVVESFAQRERVERCVVEHRVDSALLHLAKDALHAHDGVLQIGS